MYPATCLNPLVCVAYEGLDVDLSSAVAAAGFVTRTVDLDGALVVAGCLPPVGRLLPCQIKGVEMKPREVFELRCLGGLGGKDVGREWEDSGGAGGPGPEILGRYARTWGIGAWSAALDRLYSREGLPWGLGIKAGLCRLHEAVRDVGLGETRSPACLSLLW